MTQAPQNQWNAIPGQPTAWQSRFVNPPFAQPVYRQPVAYRPLSSHIAFAQVPGGSLPYGQPGIGYHVNDAARYIPAHHASQPSIPVGIPVMSPLPFDGSEMRADEPFDHKMHEGQPFQADAEHEDTLSQEKTSDERPSSLAAQSEETSEATENLDPPNESERIPWPGADPWPRPEFHEQLSNTHEYDARYGAPIIQIQQPRKTHGWIVGIVVVLCLFALMMFGMYRCSGMFDTSSSKSLLPSKDTVAVIDIDGTIQYDGSANSPEGLSKLLSYAQEEESIKAVVLRVNSGGGVATAGEEMAALVRDFSKPIVVSSASINASAAYEISSQADFIFVSKTTEIGSIGTAIEMTDLSGLMEMLGIDVEVITSSDSKDSTYGYRALTDEERAYYQAMVNQINEVFIENVAVGRGLSIEQVRRLANGLVYTGIDAVQNGLADEIGTRDDALAYAAELAGLDDYDSFDLEFSKSDLSLLEYLM